MTKEINLLSALPKSKRNVSSRQIAKTTEHIEISRKYGKMYFDGPREYGYGGYKYDGRWIPVAKDIIKHFGLKSGHKVLDIGCAKGFLVKDLLNECPGLEVFGIDISSYALKNCEKDVVGRVHYGNAKELLFPDNSFDAVLSINTIHNLNRNDCKKALSEIQRISNGNSFIQVDSYNTEEEKKIFEDWVLTAKFHDYPSGWIKLFKEANYEGFYFWTNI